MSNNKDWVSGRTCVYKNIANRLKAIFIEIGKEFDFEVKEMEVMPDHCHLFVSCHPKTAPSDIVKCLKGISARKLFLEYPIVKKKLWGGASMESKLLYRHSW